MSQAPTTLTVAAAHAVAFATYLDGETSQRTLNEWKRHLPKGITFQVDRVHDVLSVVLQIDLDRQATAAEVVELVRGLPIDSLPKGDRLGVTTFLVVKTDDPQVGAPLLRHWLGDNAGVVETGSWGDQRVAFVGLDAAAVVVTCPPGGVADRHLGERLYGNVRLMEVLCHKIAGQFGEYESQFGPKLLAANEALDRELQPLAQLLLGPPDPKVTRTMDRRDQVSAAYCRTLSALAPTQRIRAMLEANVGNLDQLSGDFLSQKRARLGRQRLAQIDADLGLVRPTLETAQALGEAHHCHLLERINVAELRDARLRDSEAGERERLNRRLGVRSP